MHAQQEPAGDTASSGPQREEGQDREPLSLYWSLSHGWDSSLQRWPWCDQLTSQGWANTVFFPRRCLRSQWHLPVPTKSTGAEAQNHQTNPT